MPQTTAVRLAHTAAPTADITQTLNRAQQLTAQINELKAELDPLRSEILQHLIENDIASIKAGDGTFKAIKKQRHNWKYSPYLERELIALREWQQEEQTSGDATDSPTIYLQLGS